MWYLGFTSCLASSDLLHMHLALAGMLLFTIMIVIIIIIIVIIVYYSYYCCCYTNWVVMMWYLGFECSGSSAMTCAAGVAQVLTGVGAALRAQAPPWSDCRSAVQTDMNMMLTTME